MATQEIKNDENESWAIIEHGVWEYEFIFTKGEMSKVGEMAGNWIDFDHLKSDQSNSCLNNGRFRPSATPQKKQWQ